MKPKFTAPTTDGVLQRTEVKVDDGYTAAIIFRLQGTYAIEFVSAFSEDVPDQRTWVGSRAEVLALLDIEMAARTAYETEARAQMRDAYALQIALHTRAGIEVPEHSRAELEEYGFDVDIINATARAHA